MDSKKLAKVMKGLAEEGKTLYVMSHREPDYDALGSQFGIAKIGESVGLEVKVCGEFKLDWGYPQNNVIYNRYNLADRMHKSCEIAEDDPVAFVDVFPGNTNSEETAGITKIIINHHPKEDAKCDLEEVDFVDAREVGSSVAQVAQHMINMGIELTAEDSELATVMLYGMRSDTSGFREEKDLSVDHSVAAYLEKHADRKLIEELEKSQPPEDLLDIIREIPIRTEGKYRIAVGKMETKNLVPQLADELSRYKGAPITLVIGKVEEETEKEWGVSARTRDDSYHVGKLMRDVFGTGGGHWNKAGAQMTEKEMYTFCAVDEGKNVSVLRQVLNSIVKKLKKQNNQK